MKFNNKNKKGFTLVELLVGSILIIGAATSIVVLLSSSFRISNKTTSSEEIRASGNSALSLISRTIQFAYGFEGVSDDNFATETITSCVTDDNVPVPYTYIRIKTSTGSTQQFSCESGHLYYDQGSGNVDLIDTNKAVISNCQFTCIQTNTLSPPVIGISFGLSNNTGSSLPEENSIINFSTSAKMRNF